MNNRVMRIHTPYTTRDKKNGEKKPNKADKKKSELSLDTFMSRIFINRSVSLIGHETETFYHYIITTAPGISQSSRVYMSSGRCCTAATL